MDLPCHSQRETKLIIPFLSFSVGAPIRVEKVEQPTQSQIDALHAQYVHALKQLFETHKHKVGCSEQTLTIY